MIKYPEKAIDVAKAFKKGEIVWSVSMGGMGPGYEQVIQCAIFGIINELNGVIPKDFGKARKKIDEVLAKLNREKDWGMSGAQAGVAKAVAYQLMKFGYKYMMDKTPRDRAIQVSSAWVKA